MPWSGRRLDGRSQNRRGKSRFIWLHPNSAKERGPISVNIGKFQCIFHFRKNKGSPHLWPGGSTASFGQEQRDFARAFRKSLTWETNLRLRALDGMAKNRTPDSIGKREGNLEAAKGKETCSCPFRAPLANPNQSRFSQIVRCHPGFPACLIFLLDFARCIC